MKLSDCPYPPSDPRWHDWQMLWIHEQGIAGPEEQFNAQHDRMARVKASVQAQRTDKHAWHDDVMREVEEYHKWQEYEKTREALAKLDTVIAAFGDSVVQVTISFADVATDILRVVGALFDEPPKIKSGRGWIPDYNFAPILDVWDWFDDERPRIAALTWLQYDAI